MLSIPGAVAGNGPDASVAAEPIISFATSNKGAAAYRQLARELISRGAAA